MCCCWCGGDNGDKEMLWRNMLVVALFVLTKDLSFFLLLNTKSLLLVEEGRKQHIRSVVDAVMNSQTRLMHLNLVDR